MGFSAKLRPITLSATTEFKTGSIAHDLLLGLDYKFFHLDHVQASGGATPISVTPSMPSS